MPDVSDRFRVVDELAAPDMWADIEARAATTEILWAPPPSGPRRWVAAAVALAVFVAGGFVAVRALLGDRAMERRERPASDPWAGLPPGWTRLPDPPFVRSDTVAVWAGDRLVLWGGGTDYNANFFADGAVFDPATGAWTPMADGPLRARADARAVWTGREVLIWGGYGNPGPLNDGAAYDPATDSWRSLSEAPWTLPSPVAFDWTGQELVIFGSTHSGLDEVSGMAYQPERDEWHVIASAPMALSRGSSAWTGAEVVVYGADLGRGNRSSTDHGAGMAYHPSTDAWRTLPDQALSPYASSLAWTGTELLVWDYETSSALYEPATDSWRTPKPMPMRVSECYPQSAATTDIVFASFCGQTAQFDIAEDRWEEVPPGPIDEPTTPQQGALPVAAGDVILMLFARPTEPDFSVETEEMWAYRPA